MSSTPTQRPNDPRQLEVLIQELEARYTELFQFIELSVRADPETEASQAMAFERQIAELFEETRARLDLFLELVRPWPERRDSYPPELAARADKFMQLLERGFSTMNQQVQLRTGDIEERMTRIQQDLKDLDKKRRAAQGYMQNSRRISRVEHKA
ncbi:MAG TPA: hypothetical protein PLA90_08655 [Candidatus Sumerlaeota bacterium]|nr:hypothetical protein [Candidatus Sumerlaeota bacterium]HPS01599.1 hypothetical protein [Candidatus Sumerlaeota bacterium]